MTIEAWVDAAGSRWAEERFLEDARSGRAVTFGALSGIVEDHRRRLLRLGVEPGERVLVALPDPVDQALALVATVASGRVAVPGEATAPKVALRRLAELSGARLALFGGGAVCLDVPRARGPDEQGSRGVDDFGGAGPARGGLLMVTSGTTGAPKGVLLDDAQLSHVAGAIATHHRLVPGERGLSPLPLHHVNAPVVAVLASLAGGATVVLDDRFHRSGFVDLVESTRATWVNAVPAIVAILAADESLVSRRGPLGGGRLRFVRSASAPLAPSVLERFETVAEVGILETYGMTEAASMIAANPLFGPRKPGSVGRPVGVELRVADEAHRPLPPGALGQVEIKGPGVIRRYAFGGGPEQFSPDGWLSTGDLGRLDGDGYLFLAGRRDDVINRGGENIAPREVEDVLLADERVASAVVVPRPDELLGEVPVAFVVPARWAGPASRRALVEQLSERCLGELPRFKVPAEIVVTQALPTGPTGKVRRRVLAARLLRAS
jgi:acyl-CoA synthetase (AMP-forming)/AMP-acid ligase II